MLYGGKWEKFCEAEELKKWRWILNVHRVAWETPLLTQKFQFGQKPCVIHSFWQRNSSSVKNRAEHATFVTEFSVLLKKTVWNTPLFHRKFSFLNFLAIWRKISSHKVPILLFKLNSITICRTAGKILSWTKFHSTKCAFFWAISIFYCSFIFMHRWF